MIIDLQTFSPSATYHLLTQTVVPRPIAWVLTDNADGNSHNLAPFSYFTAIASDPPLLLFSAVVKDKSNEQKDTVINILREKRFTIHIATTEQMQAVQATANPLPYGESELLACNLSVCELTEGFMRLQTAPIAMACSLYETQTLGNAPQTLIIGQVHHTYIDDSCVSTDGQRITVNTTALSPLARLGLGQFATLGEILKPR